MSSRNKVFRLVYYMQEFFIIFLIPELYLFNELANASLKLLLGTPTQISVRLSYQVPRKTPATSPRRIATLTLQSHNSRDSSEGSGSDVVRLHNELPESDGFVSGNGNNSFSCTVQTRYCGPRSLLSGE